MNRADVRRYAVLILLHLMCVFHILSHGYGGTQ